MTFQEYKALWATLNEDQKQSIRLKARWEAMSLWAVCNEWPDIWKDSTREAAQAAAAKGERND